jgi:hypothetical protein
MTSAEAAASPNRGSFARTVCVVREVDAIPLEVYRKFLDPWWRGSSSRRRRACSRTSGSTRSPSCRTRRGEATRPAGCRFLGWFTAGSRLVHDRRARMSARDGEQGVVGRGRGEVLVRREHDLLAAR